MRKQVNGKSLLTMILLRTEALKPIENIFPAMLNLCRQN